MADADRGHAGRLPTWFSILRVLVLTAGIVLGLGMLVLAFVAGDCDAFGGRCPSDPPPLLDDDTFWVAGLGAALVVAPSVYLSRPSWRRLGLAVGVAAAVTLMVGSIARASTST